MSRRIDLTKQLSEDERAYLTARGRQAALDLNAANLMLASDESEEAVEAEAEAAVKAPDVGNSKRRRK